MTRRGVSIAKRLHRHFHLGHHHGLRVHNDWMLNATIAGWFGTYPDHILIIPLSNLVHSYVPNLGKSKVNRNLQRDYLLEWCYLTQLDTVNVCLHHKIVPHVCVIFGALVQISPNMLELDLVLVPIHHHHLLYLLFLSLAELYNSWAERFWGGFPRGETASGSQASTPTTTWNQHSKSLPSNHHHLL